MFGKIVAKYCGRHLGLYTKKEMVRVAENIGKELVDVQKQNMQFSKEIVETTVKKHAPKVKLNLKTSRLEVEQDLIKHGIPAGEAKKLASLFDDAAGCHYCHTGGDGKCNGIFAPLDDDLPACFAHEFEHQLFQDNSFFFKIFPWLKKCRTGSELSIQRNIVNAIELPASEDMFSGLQELKPGKDNLITFLQNFDRLETPTRIKAFFRGLCRNVIHPQNKGSFKDLLSSRQIIQDEARAYGISDRILRYATGETNTPMTHSGVFSEFLNYTDEIMKQEQKVALFTKSSKEMINHSCPAPTHELSIFEKAIKRKKCT